MKPKKLKFYSHLQVILVVISVYFSTLSRCLNLGDCSKPYVYLCKTGSISRVAFLSDIPPNEKNSDPGDKINPPKISHPGANSGL